MTDVFLQSSYKPYEFIYGKYDQRNELQSLYQVDGIGSAPFFRGVDRIKLMKSIFENPQTENGAGLLVDQMVQKRCLEAAFPLHDYNELVQLQEDWLVLWQWPSNQPFTKIRNYFGEKLALYYVFLGHYTACLGWPSIIGGVVFGVWKTYQTNYEHWTLAVYAIYITAWSTVFIETWKGRQARVAMEWVTRILLHTKNSIIFYCCNFFWKLLQCNPELTQFNMELNKHQGVCGFEDEEQDRPTYTGIEIDSPIDGSRITYFPRRDAEFRTNGNFLLIYICNFHVLSHLLLIYICKLHWNPVANSIVALAIAGVFATVICIFAFQIWVNQPANATMLTLSGIELGIYLCIERVIIYLYIERVYMHSLILFYFILFRANHLLYYQCGGDYCSEFSLHKSCDQFKQL